jgi:hypothetical protein
VALRDFVVKLRLRFGWRRATEMAGDMVEEVHVKRGRRNRGIVAVWSAKVAIVMCMRFEGGIQKRTSCRVSEGGFGVT